MKLLFCTDFHEGLTRVENTTSESAVRLQAEIHRRALKVVVDAKKRGSVVINGGDLFHKHSNPEAIIKQGLEVAKLCNVVLAGNHDVINIKGSVSSLDLVAAATHEEALDDIVIRSPNPSESYFDTRLLDEYAGGGSGLYLYSVPHCFTQELFEKSVRDAAAHAGQSIGRKIMLLHCNVGTGFGHLEDHSSSLWLTEELQDLVRDHFDLVMIGHEHDPRTIGSLTDPRGAIVVMGNLFPVAFGEISDRFVYEVDTETLEVEPIQIFDAESAWAVIGADDLIHVDGVWPMEGVQFIDIEGEIEQENYGKLGRALGKLWKANPDALMVRNGATIIRPEGAEDNSALEQMMQTLPERVRAEAIKAGFETEYLELEKEVDHG